MLFPLKLSINFKGNIIIFYKFSLQILKFVKQSWGSLILAYITVSQPKEHLNIDCHNINTNLLDYFLSCIKVGGPWRQIIVGLGWDGELNNDHGEVDRSFGPKVYFFRKSPCKSVNF